MGVTVRATVSLLCDGDAVGPIVDADTIGVYCSLGLYVKTNDCVTPLGVEAFLAPTKSVVGSTAK